MNNDVRQYEVSAIDWLFLKDFDSMLETVQPLIGTILNADDEAYRLAFYSLRCRPETLEKWFSEQDQNVLDLHLCLTLWALRRRESSFRKDFWQIKRSFAAFTNAELVREMADHLDKLCTVIDPLINGDLEVAREAAKAF